MPEDAKNPSPKPCDDLGGGGFESEDVGCPSGGRPSRARCSAQGFEVVLLGGPDDPRVDVPGARDLVAKIPLGETMEWVARSALHLAPTPVPATWRPLMGCPWSQCSAQLMPGVSDRTRDTAEFSEDGTETSRSASMTCSLPPTTCSPKLPRERHAFPDSQALVARRCRLCFADGSCPSQAVPELRNCVGRQPGIRRSRAACPSVSTVLEVKPKFRPSTWPTIEGEFDAAFDMQGLLKSAIVVGRAKARRKLGYHWQREGSALFSSAVKPDPTSLHVVDQYVDVVRAYDAPMDRAEFDLKPTPEAVADVRTRC